MADRDPKAMMQQIQQQSQDLMVRNMLEKVTKKCFDKCIKKPGHRLEKSEQNCLSMCIDRYQDSYKLVFKAMEERTKQQAASENM